MAKVNIILDNLKDLKKKVSSYRGGADVKSMTEIFDKVNEITFQYQKETALQEQFYTNPKVAADLVKILKNTLPNHSIWLEPSAGNGAFSKNVDNVYAYDLEPTDESVKEQDFLKLEKPAEWEGKKIIMFGNPPFGVRHNMWKAFIKKGMDLGVTTIAFILPNAHRKPSLQGLDIFPKEWKLVNTIELPKNAYVYYQLIRASGHYKEYQRDLPTSFYVWTKDPENDSPDLREFYNPDYKPKDWTLLKRDLVKDKVEKNSDFVLLARYMDTKLQDFQKNKDLPNFYFLNQNNNTTIYRGRNTIEVDEISNGNFKNFHPIKVNDPDKLYEIRAKFESLDWKRWATIGHLGFIAESDLYHQWAKAEQEGFPHLTQEQLDYWKEYYNKRQNN